VQERIGTVLSDFADDKRHTAEENALRQTLQTFLHTGGKRLRTNFSP
jgi:hypothetical protein